MSKHTFYRRREKNLHRKVGNIAEFLQRWGKNYENMIVLDADSVMSGTCLLRMVRTMQEALERHEVLAVFPEGTTGDGRTMLPFHANLLQAAVVANAPVQPVGLRFVDLASGATSFAPSYIGDETLLGSIWRTLSAPAIEAVVTYGEPETPQGRDRRAWALHLQAVVDGLRQQG